MESQVSFYNKSNGDKELVNLISETLVQIRMYYTIKKEKNKDLEYKQGEEIDLMNVLISSSDLWIGNMIDKFEDLESNKSKKITIEKNDFSVLKYLVDFYWHNMPTAKTKFSPSIYKAFNVNFSSAETTTEEPYNILRLVD